MLSLASVTDTSRGNWFFFFAFFRCGYLKEPSMRGFSLKIQNICLDKRINKEIQIKIFANLNLRFSPYNLPKMR